MTNYETQMVNLWFGDYLSDLSEEAPLTSTQIRSSVEEQLQLNFRFGSSFESDILSNALSRVDWEELADLYVPEFLYDEM